MHVAIVFNKPTMPPEHPDYGQEAGVAESVDAFAAALRQRGHSVHEIALGNSIVSLVERLTSERPDLIVNLCEGIGGDTAGEAHFAAVVETLRIPYTGCPPECLALVRNKARTKWLLLGAGLPTAPFVRIEPRHAIPRQPMEGWLAKGPLFVKPADEDASLGIGQESVVADLAALVRQVESIVERYGAVLVEPYIDGREFNVGIIELPELQCLPLAEVEFEIGGPLKWAVVTYEGKWAAGSAADRATPVRCPAAVQPQLADRIRQAALSAYGVTGCRDYARVDLRVDGAGNIFILEVNANPDAGPTAGLARMLATAGINYNDFVERLVSTAAGRGSGLPP
jgi:D-alanine-D-alanine ligase